MARCKEKRTRKTKYANLISFPFFWDTFVQFSAEWEPAPPVCCRWSYWARTRERREQSEWGWSGATLHIPGKNKPIDMIKNLSTESAKVHKVWLDLNYIIRVNSLIDERSDRHKSVVLPPVCPDEAESVLLRGLGHLRHRLQHLGPEHRLVVEYLRNTILRNISVSIQFWHRYFGLLFV